MSPLLRRRSLFAALLFAAALVPPAAAGAQTATVPAEAAPVRAALALLETENAWTLARQVAICEIPAPPFGEAERARAFADALRTLAVRDVRIDETGNVIGVLAGTGAGPTVMLSAHLDTVFPEGTDVSVSREGTRFAGPGIGDDCRGLAVVLAVVRAIGTAEVPFAGRVLVVGTVGEEGAGNLRGVRALFGSPLRDSVDYFLSVDGTGFGITNRAVGSARYRFTVAGTGGHSYGAFGMANPIHALGRAIAAIGDLEVPREPKTTFNVGIVQGGTSVNSIAASVSMDIDMRSESMASLEALDARVQQLVRDAVAAEQARWPRSRDTLRLVVDTIGIRPAGATPDTSRLVRTARAAADALDVYAPLTASSTDANLPMSLGVPAITIDGGGRGRGAHGTEEQYDDGPDGYKGPQFVLLLVTGLLGLAR